MLVLFLLRNAIVIFGEGNWLRRTEAVMLLRNATT